MFYQSNANNFLGIHKEFFNNKNRFHLATQKSRQPSCDADFAECVKVVTTDCRNRERSLTESK